MIGAVALKEFYSNLISSRFLLGFILCLVLIPFAMFVSISDYSSRARAYEMDRKQAGENNKPRVYSMLRPEIVKPPEPLSIFSAGIANQTGSSVKIYLGEKPMLAGGRSSTRENPLMNAFFSLDFTSILVLIVTLLAFLFTYDACSGEREKGTLKLVFTSSMSGRPSSLGKCSVRRSPCFRLFSSAIFERPDHRGESAVSLGPGEWTRVALMFGLSVLLSSSSRRWDSWYPRGYDHR